MSDFQRRIANLSPQQHAQLERTLLEQRVVVDEKIKRHDPSKPCPLSFAQQRLWFLDQLIPNTPLYNIPYAVRMIGTLNVEALRQALDVIVQRHEVLRTTVGADDEGEVFQVISESRSIELAMHDLTDVTDGLSRQTRVEELLQNEARRPFNITTDLMIRAMLVCEADDQHVLLIVMHHIASDGWSLDVLARELEAHYAHFCSGGQADTPALPELPIQYADYAAWQRHRLSGEVLERLLSYWREQLGGAPPSLDLPTDRPRTHIQTFDGRQQRRMLPGELVRALQSLSVQEGATLFMTLLGAFNVLLSRYNGRDDIVLGTPITGRNRTETESLIGFFVNTLAVRIDLSGNPTFRQLLARVRDTMLGALSCNDVPYEKLVEEMDPQRNMSQSPLFQAAIAYHHMPQHTMRLGSLNLQKIDVTTGTSKFDLTLSLTETSNGLCALLEYNVGLFDTSTIDHMLGHYHALLESIVCDPDKSIEQMSMMSESEHHQVVVSFNKTATTYPYPDDNSIHHMFERQVAATPNVIAVVFDEIRLTYSQLNERANALACHLRSLKVEPDTPVGVYMNRSLEMAVAVLGVLKAGGAYLPLDPGHPGARIAWMLRESSAPVLITQRALRKALPGTMITTVLLDTSGQVAGSTSKDVVDPIDNQITGDHLAYVIYTSGSTGTPNGVAVSHGAICNHMLWFRDNFAMTTMDRVLQKTPFIFDASVWEFFAPLICGAQLVMAKPESHRSAEDLIHQINAYNITILQLVPSMLGMLLEHPGIETCTSIKQVFCGGDVLAPRIVNRFFAKLDAKLFNLYGPTEATIDATWHQCGLDDLHTVPIGRPIANMRAYLFDKHMQPVPIGVRGELYLGGAGLARGYLNRPELTTKRFVANPISHYANARIYQTGDLCRWRADGNLEFLGRNDHQVKIRGFRIELAEIESILSDHARVRQCVVTTTNGNDDPDNRQLVAYMTASGDPHQIPVDQLRNHLAVHLPDYMVPTLFVQLDEMPLTASGKVDRSALPEAGMEAVEPGVEYVAPTTEIEQRLADIWRELLQVDRVGIHDNFFALGGHSLKTMQLATRIRNAFDVTLPLTNLFEAQTVRELALVILIELYRNDEALAGTEAGPDALMNHTRDHEGLDMRNNAS